VITGYNTDVEYGGVVYHVQTEDKGLDTPIILSLVYSGGAILASRRAPYKDLIESGFDEAVLAQRLQRQHKLICAAIHAGRIDDLKKMSEKPAAEKRPLGETTLDLIEKPVVGDATLDKVEAQQVGPATLEKIEEPVFGRSTLEIEKPVDDEVTIDRPSQELASMLPTLNISEAANSEGKRDANDQDRFLISEDSLDQAGLEIVMLDESELVAGKNATLRLKVTRPAPSNQVGVARARITVKTLGTSFRPETTTCNTDEHGVAVVPVKLPSFKKGRAAILVHAEFDGDEAELRRIIMPSRW